MLSTAFAQGGGGSVLPQGAITPGNCTKFGTSKYFVTDAGFPCGSGSGSVTSVGLVAPSIFTVSGSPVTTSGTLTISSNTQSVNTFYAGPSSGGAAVPTFRTISPSDIPSTFFANPTAQVSLSAINGSAITAMRSDAAPPLNQAIAPTWTGAHTWTPSASNATPITVSGFSAGTANTNSILNISGTWNVGSGNNAGSAILLNVTNTSSSSNSLLLDLQVGGTGQFTVNRTGGTSQRGALFINNAGGNVNINNDLFLLRSAAATLQLGNANAASPVAQTLQAQGSRSGTDTNTAGATLTIRPGAGTGTATGANLIFQTYAVVASGSGAQTATTRWQIDQSGNFLAGTDNSWDIGASGASRPRDVYAGGNGRFGGSVIAVNFFQVTSKSVLDSPTNGNFRIANAAQTDFGLLQLGGTTSSFPALKRSTTSLQARLADDSAFTNIQGKLTTDTNYTAGVPTATGYITLYDATGTAYKVPACLASGC